MTRLTTLEDLLNRQLRETTPTRTLLGELEGKILCVRLKETELALYFKAGKDNLEISSGTDCDPDAIISASPLGFLRLAGPDAETLFSGGSVHIEGDAECAQSFQKLLALGRPDWEEELSRVVGDVAAHQLGNLARAFRDFAATTADTFTRNASEYFREESRDVPNTDEVDVFLRDVDDLARDFDRLRARMKKLEATLNHARAHGQ